MADPKRGRAWSPRLRTEARARSATRSPWGSHAVVVPIVTELGLLDGECGGVDRHERHSAGKRQQSLAGATYSLALLKPFPAATARSIATV